MGRSPAQIDQDLKLLPTVAKQFNAMHQAATEQGISLKLVSGYRSFERQNRLWQAKFSHFSLSGMPAKAVVQKIIEYVAIPGTSRHHWGTDIDIIDQNAKITGDLLMAKNYVAGGKMNRLYKWLKDNAPDFGFMLAYDDHPNRGGFKFEPWHFSYQPLAKFFYNCFIKLDWAAQLPTDLIAGGKELDIAFLNAYTNSHLRGINPALR